MPHISATDDLRLLAEARIEEAVTLLGSGHHSGAYYLAGYAIECGLKAVLTRSLEGHSMPDKKGVEAAHIHDLRRLAQMGDLNPDAEPAITAEWAFVVANWNVESRYRLYTEQQAIDMVGSVREVLAWISTQW